MSSRPHPSRRALVKALAAIAACAAWPAVPAEPYPTRPIRIVVPFGPGGLADITMRYVGQKLAERLGQQVVIDNKPGAGGVAAASSVLSGPADGYSLVAFSNGTAISKTLIRLPYDPETRFVPITTVAYFDILLLTQPEGPLKTVADVLAAAKRRQLTLGTIAAGSTQNLSAQLFKSTAGLNAVVVPYKGTPDVLTALMRGEIDLGFESYAALKGAIDAGQVRAIASTGSHRSPSLPRLPTVEESGLAGYEVTGWNALYAPTGTPREVLATLHDAVAEVLALPDTRARLRDLGTEGAVITPEALAALFRADRDKWAAVIRQAGIQVQ